jgi:hypothetical protein
MNVYFDIHDECHAGLLRDEAVHYMKHEYVSMLIDLKYETITGDCGRPYLLDELHEHPIVGFHVVKLEVPHLVGCSPFIREALVAARDKLKTRVEVPVTPEPVRGEIQADFVQHSGWGSTVMECCGKGQFKGEALERFVPRRTQLERSPLQNPAWEDNYRPSAMMPGVFNGEAFDPLIKSAQKYGDIPEMPVASDAFEECVRNYTQQLGWNPDSRVLTDHEAINGFGALNPVVLSTSAGYWTKYAPGGGKTSFFED